VRIPWADNEPKRRQSPRRRATSLTFALIFFCAATANAQNPDPNWPAQGQDRTPSADGIEAGEVTSPHPDSSSTICQLMESAAVANGLPLQFFARVIWQESRLRPDAIGPVTRSGHQAQGIAQFMPTTAAGRLLQDPFDPSQALPKSAEFLRELRTQFGNLGLAAAAYNAGPQRVHDWLAGKRNLPRETQAYVRNVTGRSAEEWSRAQPETANLPVPAGIPCAEVTKQIAKVRSSVNETGQKLPWGVQLIGDRSEFKALASYRQLQQKHEGILGGYEPVVLRTTIRAGAQTIWTRVRVETDSRALAEMLCSKLRAVGENCLVQRN
jgi:hypothetical protein